MWLCYTWFDCLKSCSLLACMCSCMCSLKLVKYWRGHWIACNDSKKNTIRIRKHKKPHSFSLQFNKHRLQMQWPHSRGLGTMAKATLQVPWDDSGDQWQTEPRGSPWQRRCGGCEWWHPTKRLGKMVPTSVKGRRTLAFTHMIRRGPLSFSNALSIKDGNRFFASSSLPFHWLAQPLLCERLWRRSTKMRFANKGWIFKKKKNIKKHKKDTFWTKWLQ